MKNNKLNKGYHRQPAYILLRIVKVFNLIFSPILPVMLPTVHTDTTQVLQQNISYYDEIAAQYDDLMAKEASNKLVRQQVKVQLLQVLPAGTVLDFGGGTGLDLGWLTAQHYKIIFCEPSAGMREEAIRYNRQELHNANIQFLENEQADFTRWQQQSPFSQPVDAILANFGVLNAIPDINQLFQNLAPVIKPGGHCLIVILKRPLNKMWQWHRVNTIRTLLFNNTFVRYVWHNGSRQTVYVHAGKAIGQAASPYFDLKSCRLINSTSFLLLHLVKK